LFPLISEARACEENSCGAGLTVCAGARGMCGRPRQRTASRDRCARLFTVEACPPQRTPAR